MGWNEWKREQLMLRGMETSLKRMRVDVDYLEGCLAEAWAEGDRRMAARLNANPRWRRTVNEFLDMRVYRKMGKMSEWKWACGTDGRLWKETSCLGWPRLWRVLLMSRKMRRG